MPDADRQLQPNGDTIAAALGMFCPSGPLLLVVIDPARTQGNVEGRTFTMPAETGQAVEWVAQRNANGWNAYWTPNEARPMNNKSGKRDMTRARFFWADCDPDVFRHRGYEPARQHLIESTLPRLRAKASFVIDSGHGLQAFWMVHDGENLASLQAQRDFESLNEQLGALYGSSGTHNVDRVMRIPGTVNYPNAAKITKGYPEAPTMARLLAADGVVYSVAEIAAMVGRETMNERLRQTLATHPAIAARFDGDRSGLRDQSGSAMDQSMVTMLALTGWELQDIRRALEHWPHGSLQGRQQGERYWTRMWEKALAHRDQPAPEVEIDLQAGQPDGYPLAHVWADEITDVEILDELVEDTITRGAMSVLYGESNTGKSFLAMDIACAIARSATWMDRRTEGGLVVYLAAEGNRTIRNRVRAYEIGHGCKVANLMIVLTPVNLLRSGADVAAVIKQIRMAAEERGMAVELVVGDTLSRLMAGGNENASEDMTALVAAGDKIRAETGAHFMWIHHCGKDAAKGARGHSSLRAAVDTEIEIREEQGTRVIEFTKQRDLGSKNTLLTFTLEQVPLGSGKWGKPVTSCVVRPGIDPAEIIASAGERMTRYEQAILDAFGGSKEQPESALRDAFYASVGDKNQNAKRQAWWRTIKSMQEKGLIEQTARGVWGAK
jgi:hypothetical protein